MTVLRPIVVVFGLLLLWQSIVWLTGAPPYILPAPERVVAAWWRVSSSLLSNAGTTLLEIVLGIAIGALLGIASALTLSSFRRLRLWLLPVLVASQAVPVFALAPLLVLWLGYGLASKVAMATLIIYFPVTVSFFDGLRRTDPAWIDLARSMDASPWAILRHIRIPAALPALASGLRVAVAVAPIGAVVGEWVGASAGLGYMMLHANGRMQTDVMFAALLTLAVLSVALYFATDIVLKRLLTWQPDR
ncbi:MAG: ABC transporter permease [Rhodospirillaceae bacterium]|nr:ABC transporter permease [Rhodospirillaceae bacterium]